LVSEPVPAAPLADSSAPAPDAPVASAAAEGRAVETEALEAQAPEVQAPVDAMEPRIITQCAEPDSAAAVVALESVESGAANPARPARRSLVQKMRDWLRRAA
jgi:8-oxo-dGTP diphosphatase